MQKLLLQKTTGCVYPWNSDLAKRNDMVEYVPQPKAPDEVASAGVVAPEDEVKAMAKAVLTKKPGRKPNGEASVGEAQSQEAE